MQEYLSHTETIDITPPIGVYLAGFDNRGRSTGVYRRLRGTVTALSDGTTTTLIVVFEWLGFYDRTQEARRRLTEATGIPGTHILLSGTHTHCGPTIRRHLDLERHGEIDEGYIDRAFTMLASAAKNAQSKLAPVTLTRNEAWCGFAASRRYHEDDGSVSWRPTLDAAHDHRVPMLVLRGANQEIQQLFFVYACHPTSMGPVPEIGGDYPAFACDHIERKFSGTATFLCGCAGDQKPGLSEPATGEFRRAAVPEVKELGEQLGRMVTIAAESQTGQAVTGELRVAQRFVGLEVAKAEATNAQSPPVRFEIQTVCFGRSLAIIALAAEMSAEYALLIQHRLGDRFEQVIVLGYSNEIVGYVPTERQIPFGGYEVVGNNKLLGRSGPFVEGTQQQIIDTIAEMVAE